MADEMRRGVMQRGTQVPQYLAAALVPLAIAVAVWLPAGFHISPTGDGWAFRMHVEIHGGLLLHPDSARLLGRWSHNLAYFLSPDSFVGEQQVLCLLTVVRALLLFMLLVRLVPWRPSWAFVVSVVYLSYPSDTGLFWTGALIVHANVAIFLLTLNLLLSCWQRPGPWRLAAMLASLGVCLWSYEAYLPLLLLSPLALWAVERPNGGYLRRTLLVWYVPSALWIAHKTFNVLQGHGARAANTFDLDVGAMAKGVLWVYARNLWAGWWELLTRLEPRPTLLAALGAAVATGWGVWFLDRSRRGADGDGVDDRRWLVVAILVGMVVILLAFVAYLPSSVRTQSSRTMLLSSAGGSIVVVSACYLLVTLLPPPRRTLAWGLLAGLLACGSTTYGIQQREKRVALSLRQQMFLSSIVEAVPAVKRPPVFLVLFDRVQTRMSFGDMGRLEAVLGAALGFIYEDYRIRALSKPRSGETIEIDDDVLTVDDGRTLREFPLPRLLILSYSDDGGIRVLPSVPEDLLTGGTGSGYAPDRVIDLGRLSPRACTLFVDAWTPPECALPRG